jgi:hypothetical protein
MAQREKTAAPTTETYEALQTAYDFFNEALFGGNLKSCLITLLGRDRRVRGIYRPQRFVEIKGKAYTDEIAMNPQRFTSAPLGAVLSTLVHEQVHLWQFHFGRPSRHGYHNREWGSKMKEIGLYPSHTGAVGDRETGQRVTHYVIKGGPFDKACQNLLGTKFALKWGEAIADCGIEDEDGKDGADKKNKSNRVKYCCPDCDVAVWGRPILNIICGECKIRMEAEE